ncbi:MAG: family 10 glycosylhydrolase [Chloroflexota bacterium]|nr:family 10 glycosylhydrolase [Chloroflexota bacterium]
MALTSGAKPAPDGLGDRAFSRPPIYRTDLDLCTPASALSPDPRRRAWRTLPYSTDAFNGVMLLAGPETAAPTITYPLNAKGWHAVSIGVHPFWSEGEGRQVEVQLKLNGPGPFTVLAIPRVPFGNHSEVLHEMFWDVADLTGRDLVIGQPSAGSLNGNEFGTLLGQPTRIAYVKLVPLTAVEVRAVAADRAHAETRRLFAHQDAHGPHSAWRLTSADEIRREVEPYRHTDFSRLYWECGSGDLMNYLTAIGRTPTHDGLEDFPRQSDRVNAESWRVLRDKGIDPLQVAAEHAREVGIEFHASYRVAGFYYPPPLDHFNHGNSVYKRRPEWRGYDREGGRTPRFAYTHPEVRAYVISLLREVAQYPVDGVCMLYNRRLPVVEYELQLVDGFSRAHGVDPRTLDRADEAWLRFRSNVLTQFHRELRAAMDEEARTQGRGERLQISAVVMSSEAENLRLGIDLKAWVDEGLVDTLIPYTSVPNLDSSADAWADPRSIAFFVNLARNTQTLIAPNMLPRQVSPEHLRRRASGLYRAGVQNLFFWDCAGGSGRANYSDMWSALRRLGHVKEIETWRSEGEPVLAAPRHEMTAFGDWNLRYQTPG